MILVNAQELEDASCRAVDQELEEVMSLWATLPTSDGAPTFSSVVTEATKTHGLERECWPLSPVVHLAGRRPFSAERTRRWPVMKQPSEFGHERPNAPKESGRGFNMFVSKLRKWVPDPKQYQFSSTDLVRGSNVVRVRGVWKGPGALNVTHQDEDWKTFVEREGFLQRLCEPGPASSTPESPILSKVVAKNVLESLLRMSLVDLTSTQICPGSFANFKDGWHATWQATTQYTHKSKPVSPGAAAAFNSALSKKELTRG